MRSANDAAPGTWAGWDYDRPLRLMPGEEYRAHMYFIMWAQLEDPKSAEGFYTWLRSRKDAGEIHNIPKATTVQRWMREFNWQQRRSTWAAQQAEALGEEKARIAVEMTELRARLATELIEQASAMIELLGTAVGLARSKPDKVVIRPSEIVRVVEAAVELSRSEHGTAEREGTPGQTATREEILELGARLIERVEHDLLTSGETEDDDA